MQSFPIDSALPEILTTLSGSHGAVLTAPPGAGKTTRVPLSLLSEQWLGGKKIIMLEPRRLAAVRAAQFMASLLGEREGETVGYRIRGDTKIGPRTRIEVVTEGVLTRSLQNAPDLPGFGLVIFDEFHERSIHADLGLAFCLDVREHLRPDLKVLVMSATLDCAAVARLMDNAPVLESAGRSYPVETRFRSFPVEGGIEPAVAQTVRTALDAAAGDVLVFLPGQREIRRVDLLLKQDPPEGVDVHSLFGEAPAARQRAALSPAPRGKRKVILSTSIAETSLTIDGVRIVVDSGLARRPQFDPRRGMSGLVTLPVSRATADQRRGRAGREAPGVCFRLWTEHQHESLPPFPVPEILVTDLAPLVLDCAMWGTGGVSALKLLDFPPPAHVQQARNLLQNLGALDQVGTPTSHGKRMADLPVHPRLSHMILKGHESGWGARACEMAALLEERDILRERGGEDIDVGSRVHALATGTGADPAIRERVLRESERLRGLLRVSGSKDVPGTPGALLSLAYPERIARRRADGGNRYLMAGGTGALVPDWSPLAREEFLAIAEVEGGSTNVRVFLASPLAKPELIRLHRESITSEEFVSWDVEREAVVGKRSEKLGALTIDEQTFHPTGEALRRSLFEGISAMGIDSLPWSTSTREFQARSEWLRTNHHVKEDWPDISDGWLISSLEGWLPPFIEGVTSRRGLGRIDLGSALRSMFTATQLRDLDRLAPSRIEVPSGSKITLIYGTDAQPTLAVRLQEMFGLVKTPVVAGGRVSVLLHLLSPAGRPLAVTQDLPSFWGRAYPELRRQMQARYPKHHWPEDPLKAIPTKRTRRR